MNNGNDNRVLITGATGFVGTHLRKYLLHYTDWVIYGTSFPDPPPESGLSSREIFIQLDLRNQQKTQAYVADVNPAFIIHLAAQSHVPTAYKDPWGTLQNNIQGQLNLLEACVKLGIKPRTLIIGSSEEYGRANTDDLPLTEDHPLRPENPYSVSKVAQDMLGYQYFRSYDLPIIRLRPFNHIGPGQSSHFVLPAFASQIARIEAQQVEPVIRVGNLTPARDFTDVRDVVRAYHLALLNGKSGEVYNIASGRAYSMQYLVDQLLSHTDRMIEVAVDSSRFRPADTPIVYGSAAYLKQHTGWVPEITIESTIFDVLNEWRSIVFQEKAKIRIGEIDGGHAHG
ncbi:MAG: SDR family oxidoreductase [Anaerolineales bacterium]|nr:MAG: SDR family oxidoreductase [Anaerolineales bacterium]